MHFWVISAFEPVPTDDARPTRTMGVAQALCERGHEVTHWTGSFRHYDKTQRFATDRVETISERYTVRVLRSWAYRRHHSPRRLLAHRHLGLRLGRAMSRAARPDVILISTPPLGTVSAAIRYGRRERVPVVVDVIDPWPDVFETLARPHLRPLARLALSPFSLEARSIFRGATAIFGISQQYVDWAQKKAGELRPGHVFYPSIDLRGFDRHLEALGGAERSWEAGGRLRFVYAGSHGSSYDVETIVRCARHLEADGFHGAEFHIAGDGPKRRALETLARGMDHVHILGWVTPDELVRLYGSGHAAIACYAKGATQSVTYKLFDYLGAGLPILSSLPGEMARLIERERVGHNYPAEDARALAARVRAMCERPGEVQEMSRRGRAFAEREGSNRVVYGRMAELLESVTAR